jgi:hypothetical protein
MRKNSLFEPRFRLLSPVFFGLLVYVLLLLLNNQLALLEKFFRTQEMYVCIVLAVVQFESLGFLIRWSEKTTGRERQRLWMLALPGNVLATLLVLTLLYVYYLVYVGFSPAAGDLIRFAGLYFPGGWFYLALYTAQYFLMRENQRLLARETEKGERLEDAFTNFSHELAPELLNSCLEALLLMQQTDPKAADAYLGLLARHYRYRLQNRQEEVVPLTDELTACEEYLSLLNPIRTKACVFTGKLPVSSDFYLPPGALQTAVYALLYNSLGQPETLELSIEQQYLHIRCQQAERLLPHADSLQAFARLEKRFHSLSDQQLQWKKMPREQRMSLPLLQIDPYENSLA